MARQQNIVHIEIDAGEETTFTQQFTVNFDILLDDQLEQLAFILAKYYNRVQEVLEKRELTKKQTK